MCDKRELILTTINELYPKYLMKRVIKKLESNCLISNEDDLFSNSSLAVNISDVSKKDDKDLDEKNTPFLKIERAVTEKVECINVIEEMEYELPYKYAVLFALNKPLDDNINNLIENGIIKNFDDKTFEGDICTNFDFLEHIKPTFKSISENVDALKFSHLVTGYLPTEGNNKRIIKYPIIVLIHKKLNVLEVRFDHIKGLFKNGDEYFYVKEVKKVLDWIESYLNGDLIPLDLQPTVEYVSKKDSTEVNVAAQAMNLKAGSKAVLDTGVNDEYVLPLLGELKQLIKENEELFNTNKKTMEILNILENFIFETEETSDLPWISLSWPNAKKSKTLKVKFSFNYKGQDYDLLQYYGSNAEMERMNYVTQYLIENKREYEFSEPEQPQTEKII